MCLLYRYMLAADWMSVRKSSGKSYLKCIKLLFNNRLRFYFNFFFLFWKGCGAGWGPYRQWSKSCSSPQHHSHSRKFSPLSKYRSDSYDTGICNKPFWIPKYIKRKRKNITNHKFVNHLCWIVGSGFKYRSGCNCTSWFHNIDMVFSWTKLNKRFNTVLWTLSHSMKLWKRVGCRIFFAIFSFSF